MKTGEKQMQQQQGKQGQQGSEMIPRSSSESMFSFEDFDNFFDDFLSRRWPRLMEWGGSSGMGMELGFPKVDILDRDNEIEVQAALPGFSKDDLEISINNQMITLRATTQKQEEQKTEGKYFRREIRRGEFQRTLALPENVDFDNAQASFKDGILRVVIPKTEKSQRKSIEIH